MTVLSNYISTLFESMPEEIFEGDCRMRLVASYPEYAAGLQRGNLIDNEDEENWFNCRIIYYSRISALKLIVEIYPLYLSPGPDATVVEYWLFKEPIDVKLYVNNIYPDENFYFELNICYLIYRKILITGNFKRIMRNMPVEQDNNYDGCLEEYKLLIQFDYRDRLLDILKGRFNSNGFKNMDSVEGFKFSETRSDDGFYYYHGVIKIKYNSSMFQPGRMPVDYDVAEFNGYERVEYNDGDIMVHSVNLQKDFTIITPLIYKADLRWIENDILKFLTDIRQDGENIFPACNGISLRFSPEDNMVVVDFDEQPYEQESVYKGFSKFECTFLDIRKSNPQLMIFGTLMISTDEGEIIRNDYYDIVLVFDASNEFTRLLDESDFNDSLHSSYYWVISDNYEAFYDYDQNAQPE